MPLQLASDDIRITYKHIVAFVDFGTGYTTTRYCFPNGVNLDLKQKDDKWIFTYRQWYEGTRSWSGSHDLLAHSPEGRDGTLLMLMHN